MLLPSSCFSRVGPRNERWQGLFVPLTADTGLAEVHCTWGGVFVAEAIAAMRPSWHLLLSDTDVAPTALFEIEELVRLCAKTCHAMLEACTPGIIVGTEPDQDINAGLVIFPGTCTPAQPGCLRRRIMAARRHLLEREFARLPRRVDPPPPSTTLSEDQVCGLATALKHAEHNHMAALSRTPLAGILANGFRDYLTAWHSWVPGPAPWFGLPLTMRDGPKPASHAMTSSEAALSKARYAPWPP